MENQETKQFTCGLCLGKEHRILIHQKVLNLDYARNEQEIESHNLDYVVCSLCGTVMLFPLPAKEILDKYYMTITPGINLNKYFSHKEPLLFMKID